MNLLKPIISLVVGFGVDRVITDAIKATAPETITPAVKILRKAGTIALGCFIGDWASTKAEETYDQVASKVSLKKINNIIESTKEQLSENDSDFEEEVEETEKEMA